MVCKVGEITTMSPKVGEAVGEPDLQTPWRQFIEHGVPRDKPRGGQPKRALHNPHNQQNSRMGAQEAEAAGPTGDECSDPEPVQ